MTQEYIETVVLDDPLGEAKKPLVGDAADVANGHSAGFAAKDDDAPADPGNYSWLS